MKAHLTDRHDQMLIIGFLASFKPACDANNIHERAAKQVLPDYVKETFANALNSRMCAKDRSTSRAVSVHRKRTSSGTPLRACPKFYNCSMKKVSTDRVIVEYEAIQLRYMKPFRMIPRTC